MNYLWMDLTEQLIPKINTQIICSRRKHPAIQELFELVHQKGIFPSGKTSLKLLLKEIGFKFKEYNGRKFVIEQPQVINQRHSFLRKVRKYCRNGRPIIYLDETWLNAHHEQSKCWIDKDETGGVPVKSGKGGRGIIVHAGWEKAWIQNASLVFQGKTVTGDYHHEVNIDNFMEWFEQQLLPNIPAHSP